MPPTVSIEMFKGRDAAAKVDLVSQVTEAVTASLGVAPAQVRVKIYEIEKHHSAVGGVLNQQPPE